MGWQLSWQTAIRVRNRGTGCGETRISPRGRESASRRLDGQWRDRIGNWRVSTLMTDTELPNGAFSYHFDFKGDLVTTAIADQRRCSVCFGTRRFAATVTCRTYLTDC